MAGVCQSLRPQFADKSYWVYHIPLPCYPNFFVCPNSSSRQFFFILRVSLLGANYTSQSPPVSECVSASEYSAGRKVPIGFCVSSYFHQSMSIIFADIHPHPNITKLNTFYIRILTSEGSLKGNNFLIFCSIVLFFLSFFFSSFL